ncbi:MAG: aminoglycoside 6-adenylyltransferase [Clostridia bacterium]|nr:aminoglycoside 6-adenylyltransferase [Clostridia bacterium]
MRTDREMLDLIVGVAESEESVRAVLLGGSRTDPDAAKDVYRDFDIVYLVKDVSLYWDDEEWIEKKFGKPALLQKPESMRLIPPDGDGNYVYLMLFPDGNRIDLTFTEAVPEDDGEPVLVLLDKDGILPEYRADPGYWYVEKPDQKLFSNCCNEFYWCLQNAAKGLARREAPYAMDMRDWYVRDMLIRMISWRIGVARDFRVSVGKHGKRFRLLLPEEEYRRYLATYSGAELEEAWDALFRMTGLFGDTARFVAGEMGFSFREEEEKAARDYLGRVRSGGMEPGEKDETV